MHNRNNNNYRDCNGNEDFIVCFFEVFHRGKADKKLDQVKCSVNEVLSADDMTLTKTFSLSACGRDSKLTVRLAMRVSTIML